MALNMGDRAPDFTLLNVDGNLISLNDLGDAKAIGVVFNCNHCPYALAWEDRLIQIQKDYAEKAVRLVLINANDALTHPADSFDAMQRQALAKGYPFPYLHDESQETARAYGGERTPHVFLFDQERRLVYRGAVDDSYDDPKAVKDAYLRDAIDATLAGETPSVSETPAVGCTIKWKR